MVARDGEGLAAAEEDVEDDEELDCCAVMPKMGEQAALDKAT